MADTKISALTITSAFQGDDDVAVSDVTNTSNKRWQVKAVGGITRRTISTAGTVVPSDRAKVLSFRTDSTFSQAFITTATMGDGWWCIVKNTGATAVTLNPYSTQTLDGVQSITLQQYVERILYTDGSNWFSLALRQQLVDTQTFTGNGTWTKHPWAISVKIDIVGGGGGGGGGRGGAAG